MSDDDVVVKSIDTSFLSVDQKRDKTPSNESLSPKVDSTVFSTSIRKNQLDYENDVNIVDILNNHVNGNHSNDDDDNISPRYKDQVSIQSNLRTSQNNYQESSDRSAEFITTTNHNNNVKFTPIVPTEMIVGMIHENSISLTNNEIIQSSSSESSITVRDHDELYVIMKIIIRKLLQKHIQ